MNNNLNEISLLPEDKFFDMLKNWNLKYSEKMTIKDDTWNILDSSKISIEEYYWKYYINNESLEISEIVLIKDKEKADIFHNKFKESLENKYDFDFLKIDDNEIFEILESSFKSDQEMRKKWNEIDSKKDLINLKIAVSALENNLNFLLSKWKEENFKHIFIIIQHWPLKFQKKYIDFFTKISKDWRIKKSNLALMIDRILMKEWKPQLYWTQYNKNMKTWKLELYLVKDSTNLNKIRLDMWLWTIEEQNEKIN